jgi:hypothetical protein
MTRREDLPDLGDITGLFDAEMRPLLRREVTDAPDPKRIAEMDAQYRERLDAMPSAGVEPDDWNVELYGTYEGPIPSEYRQADYERNSPTHWGISQQDLDALDARDAKLAQDTTALWNDFSERWPDLARDPALVAEAIEIANAEIRDYGDNPIAVARQDRANYLKHVAQVARNGSTTRQNLQTYREYGIEPDEGRSTSLSYGEGARHSPEPDTRPGKDKDPAGSMRDELISEQRNLGLW